MKSCEQVARDILERMDIEGAQSYTAGDLVELGNIIAENRRMTRVNDELRTSLAAADRLAEAVREELESGEVSVLSAAYHAYTQTRKETP